MSTNLNLSHTFSGVIVPLLVIGGFVAGYFVILPSYREWGEQKTLLEQKEQVLQSRKNSLSSIDRLIEDLQSKEVELDSIDQSLPTEPEIAQLLANFDFLAQNSGLKVGSARFAEAKTMANATAGTSFETLAQAENLLNATKNLGIMEADLNFTGQYKSLKTFLINLEKNLRLMDIRKIVISANDQDTDFLEISVKMHIYYQTDGAAAAPKVPAEAN